MSNLDDEIDAVVRRREAQTKPVRRDPEADRAADEAVRQVCEAFASRLTAASARPFLRAHREDVFKTGLFGGRRVVGSKVVDDSPLRGWPILSWRRVAWTGSYSSDQDGVLHFAVTSDGAPTLVLKHKDRLYRGQHPELQGLERATFPPGPNGLPVSLAEAPTPLAQWLADEFDLAPERGHSSWMHFVAAPPIQTRHKHLLEPSEVADALVACLARVAGDVLVP